jgi:gamma-glutamyltranspeptidase/glutathione hydrolase
VTRRRPCSTRAVAPDQAPTPHRCAPRATARCRRPTTSAPSPSPAASTAGSRCTPASGNCRSPTSCCRRTSTPPKASRPARSCRGSRASWPIARAAPTSPPRRTPARSSALEAVVAAGRHGFYGGEFGAGLLELGGGLFTPDDLATAGADWVEPLSVDAWDRTLWTIPPNSQGYLTLAGAWIAAGLALPADPDDPQWAHLTVEAARQAAYDRVEVLHDRADGAALLDPQRLEPRRAAIRTDRAAVLGDSYAGGGTIYLCAVDRDRMGVSLIQSNASGFGTNIAEPSTGIFLHNRGIGFSLEPGHPAELAPGRRPPHTLSPALVTTPDGRLDMVVGTMGGDTQPLILLQVLARMLGAGETVGDAIAAPRWALANADGGGGFSTWAARGEVQVELEPAAAAWAGGLTDRGHRVRVTDGNYGHAHAIAVRADHLEGAADPRALSGEAAAY